MQIFPNFTQYWSVHWWAYQLKEIFLMLKKSKSLEKVLSIKLKKFFLNQKEVIKNQYEASYHPYQFLITKKISETYNGPYRGSKRDRFQASIPLLHPPLDLRSCRIFSTNETPGILIQNSFFRSPSYL